MKMEMIGMVVKTVTSNLKCKHCDNVFPIPRRKGSRRGSGHIKHLWCINCKDRTEHVELAYKWA